MRDCEKFPRNLPSQIKICLREICLGFQQNPDLGQVGQGPALGVLERSGIGSGPKLLWIPDIPDAGSRTLFWE